MFNVQSCNVCTTISRLDHASYEVPCAQESGTLSGDRVTIQRYVPLGSVLNVEPERT